MQDPLIVRADTERWLARAVIGLNLCPFAKAVQAKGLLHIAVSGAQEQAALLEDLARELDELVARDADERETTLLVAPGCLQDFLDFHDFTGRAERLLRQRGVEGEIQLATFHPAYQFAGSDPDDVTNFTNRSPYPTLHLLRESSIDRAVQAFPDAAAIYETNMETLRRLGPEGWSALHVGASR
jgi:hypothetical protein